LNFSTDVTFQTYYFGVTEIVSRILSWVDEQQLDLSHPLINDLVESVQLRKDFNILAESNEWLYDLEQPHQKITDFTTSLMKPEIPTYDDD